MNETRYREAERRLWGSVGVIPTERRVRLAASGVEVRVLEAGEGDPVLFVHGGPSAGSEWAHLAAELPGIRAIMVDRPGTGLSDPLPRPLNPSTCPVFADRFAVEVLDALAIHQADVVGSSFGGYVALRAAAAHPQRFRRMVQLGCPAFVAGMHMTPMLRALASPLRHLIRRLPASDAGTRMSLRQIGHAASLAGGRMPGEFISWYTALQANTHTFEHEGVLIAGLASPMRGFDPSITLDAERLRSVRTPTLVVWGADEPFAPLDAAKDLVASLPDAELVVFPDAGHLPWLDDPEGVASRIADHLSRVRPSLRT